MPDLMASMAAAEAAWRPITARFDAIAAQHHDRIAVEAGGAAVTYQDMAARVARFADRIAARMPAGTRGPVIGVCLDRDVDLPAWLMAVLRVGGAYLPLDPTQPPARLQAVIDDAAPVLIVAARGLAPALPDTGVPILFTDDDAPAPPAPIVAIPPDALAYVIFTSGSTGRPKGVEIEHGSLAALMTTMAASPGLAAGERMLGLTRISFDLSVPDLFLPLAVGGTLVLVGLDVAADPARLAAAIDEGRPDLIQGTPSTWRALLEGGWHGRPGMRLLAGGETMTRDLADRLLPCCGELWNIYGPTEATVWATATRVRAGDGPVPIGWPMTGVAVDIVDDALRPLPPGETGEIVIGGPGVARGYRHRPELTAERFVRLADGRRVYRTGDLGRFTRDGALFCLGRSDDQVKLRGFRVELGDVEAAMSAHPDIAWAAARLWTDPAGEPTLVGYVVPRLGTAPTTGDVRRALAGLLPPYMLPDRFQFVPAMPLTPNGKVDRAALPSPFTAAALVRDGEPGVAARLAAIWCELLGVAAVTQEDDFFELGGYSLMTVRLARRIAGSFGVTLAPVDLMRWSTLAAMAGRIERGADDEDDPATPCMPLNDGGTRTPLYWLDAGPMMRAMLRGLDAGQPALALNLTARDESRLGGGGARLIPAIAAVLRARLTALQPTGALHLGGWCRWGIVAFELAAQLAAEGREVALLVLLDADRPRARPRLMLRRRLEALLRVPGTPAEPASLSQRVAVAAAAYRPQRYDGEVLLVRPRSARADEEARGGWRALLDDRLAVATTGGDHETMVRPPHATEIAAAITRRLDQLDHAEPDRDTGDVSPRTAAG